jgi:hypothetical protein
MNTNPLIGKTVTGMKIAEDREALLFQTTEGDMLVRVDADCCSYTWVESVELPALGFPALVTAVEELEMPESATPSTFHKDPDVLAFYGCKISTDRGEIVIDYRNDSNGYYGGSLSWPGEGHYGGVFGQANSKMEWREIGADNGSGGQP